MVHKFTNIYSGFGMMIPHPAKSSKSDQLASVDNLPVFVFGWLRNEKAVEPCWELSLSRVMLAAWKRDEKLFRYSCYLPRNCNFVQLPYLHASGVLNLFWYLTEKYLKNNNGFL